MERNIREFLRETGAEELEARKVLSANRRWAYLLQGKNVLPLMEMMREHGVTKLVSHDGKWFLTSEGKFANPRSRETKEGLVKQLKKPGNVFWDQNPVLNPYYDPLPDDGSGRFESTNIRPLARVTLDRQVMSGKPCIRGMRITVGTIVGLVASGYSREQILAMYPYLEADDISEALSYAAKRVSQVKTYLFSIDIEQEEDGRWSADIPVIPVCAAWGFTKEEALVNLQDLTQGYLEMLVDFGDPLPEGIDSCEMTPGNQVVPGLELVSVCI